MHRTRLAELHRRDREPRERVPYLPAAEALALADRVEQREPVRTQLSAELTGRDERRVAEELYGVAHG